MTVSRRRFFRQCAAGTFSITTLRNNRLFDGSLSFSSEEVQPAGLIRLDNNENVYGPSKTAIRAMQESLALTNRYPDTEYNRLLEVIARMHEISPEQVILGCGSSEILRMVAATFLGPRKKVLLASPTFDLMAEEARKLNCEVVTIPLTKKYAHNLDAMLASVGESAGVVYICNPNNPTGTLTPRRDLEAFLRKLPASTHVVIDEAYHHYVPPSSSYASFLDHPLGDDRIIVTRTLSAIYGLAGLRIGYGIASVGRARQLSAARLQSGVNIIAVRTAAAALNDSEFVRYCVQQTTNDRQEFLNMANARMLRVLDSLTNFVMLKTGRNAEDVIEHFRKNNILLGPAVPSMPTYIRISLGTVAEMKEFWRVWDLQPAQARKMEM